MLFAILCFTLMDALAKELVGRYPFVQVVWARFVGQLLLVALILRQHLPGLARTRYPLLHLIRGTTQVGATTLFFASLPHIGLAEATALSDINPVLITLGAALFLGERLGPARVAGVLVAMCGAMIVIRPGADVFTPAAFLPLMGAVCYAASALLTRVVGPNESAWTAMILGAALGALVTGLRLPFVWVPIPAGDLPLFAVLGALGTLAQLCIIRSFSIAEASVVAPFGYTGIVFAALWGIVFFGEYPDLPTVLGALVIVAAGLYVWRHETRAALP
jgi:drug/metabolite transporter (DMT)-like permease